MSNNKLDGVYFGTVLRDHPYVEKQAQLYPTTNRDDLIGQTTDIPQSFDGRQVWRRFLTPIVDQIPCHGGGWAIAVATMLNDRYSIYTLNQILAFLSSVDLLYCSHVKIPTIPLDKTVKSQSFINTQLTDEQYSSSICGNHSLYDAINYVFVYGITETDCISREGLDTINFPRAEMFKSREELDNKTDHCKNLLGDNYEHCLDNKMARRVYRSIGTANIPNNEHDIMKEIYLNGTVVSGFLVYDDFLNYDGLSIYQGPSNTSKPLGGMAVRVLGWGTNKDTKIDYWIIAPNLGKSFGLGGYFKMKRNIKECMLEDNVVIAIPDIPSYKIFNELISQELTNSFPLYRERVLQTIDESTKYPLSTLELIKQKKLKGYLQPLIANFSLLPNYKTFKASDAEFLLTYEESGNNNSRVEWIKILILSLLVIALTALAVYLIMKFRK